MPRSLDSILFGLRFSLRRYTDQAVNSLLSARRYAAGKRLAIGPEHVLFGLAELPGGPAVAVLDKLGLDLAREGEAIRALVDCCPQASRDGSPSLDTRTEQLLMRAEENARQLGLKYVGSEHLVLGLLSGDGPSVDYLRERGITSERFLAELKILYADPRSAGL